MKRYWFLILSSAFVAMPVVAVVVLALTGSFRVRELPVFGTLPEFSLIERSGRPYGSSDLQGRVWVASFIFTHCAGQCPAICLKVKEMVGKLRFKENMRFVSFSVDPARDTPQRLKEYADQFQADPFKWMFLTGEKKQVDALTQNGFRLSSGGNEDITHSFQLVLVDGAGRIRGYYDGTDDGAVRTLLRDAKFLLKQTFTGT